MTLPSNGADLNHLNFATIVATFSHPEWNITNQSSTNLINPAEDNSRRDGGEQYLDKRRRKWRIGERLILEKAYQEQKWIDKQRQSELAVKLNVSEKQILYWFKNRRRQDIVAASQIHQNPFKEYKEIKAKQKPITRPSSTTVHKNSVGINNNNNNNNNNSNFGSSHGIADNHYWRNYGHNQPYLPPDSLHNSMTSNVLNESPDYYETFPTSNLVPPQYPMPNTDQRQASLPNAPDINDSKTEPNPSYWNEQTQEDFLDFLDEIADSFVQGST